MRFSRLIASSLAAALIITAPGLPCYQALAQLVPTRAGAGAGVAVVGAAAASSISKPGAVPGLLALAPMAASPSAPGAAGAYTLVMPAASVAAIPIAPNAASFTGSAAPSVGDQETAASRREAGAPLVRAASADLDGPSAETAEGGALEAGAVFDESRPRTKGADPVFAEGGSRSVLAPPDGAAPQGGVVTMAELLRRKSKTDIEAEVLAISLSVDWARWFDEIKSYMDSGKEENVLLVLDAADRIQGYLMLGHGYNSDDKRTTVYGGDIYIGYLAVRQDAGVKGAGKKLFLEAARQAKLHGEDELVLHVKKGEPAIGFYHAMGKYTPIKSQFEDETYVAGETWIKMTFDLSGFSSDLLVRTPLPAPTPAAKAEPEPKAQRFFSAATVGFLASFFANEMWIEAIAFAFPLLSQSVSAGFGGMAVIGGLATAALALGSFIGGPIADRFGVRKTYLSMFAFRVVMAGGLAALYDSPYLGIAGLGALLGLSYLSIGISRVAESNFSTAQYGSSIPLLNRFGTWQLRVLALVGILGGAAVAGTISGVGFASMLMIFTGVMAAGGLIAALTVRTRGQAVSDLRMSAVPESWRLLRENPMLQRAALGFGVPMALLFFLYMMVLPAFALYTASGPGPIAAVMAWGTGLYSAGGFLAASLSDWQTKRAEKRLSALTEVPETQRAAALKRVFLRSTRRWVTAAAVSLLSFWALAITGPAAGIFAALGAALLGFTATGAMVQSDSLLRSEAPEKMQGTFLGTVRTLVMTLIALGFIPLGLIFSFFSEGAADTLAPSSGAFVALGLIATAGAVGLASLAGKLRVNLHASSAPLPELPALTPGSPDRVTTLRDLLGERPSEEIKAAIRAVSAHAGFEAYADVIDSYLSLDGGDVLLAVDAEKHIIGFLMLDDRITTDFGGRTVLPGPAYVAYMAARPDTKGRGIGKKLLLAAARHARRTGTELLLHVEADSPAVEFYKAVGKSLPIKSEAVDRSYMAEKKWIKFVYDVSDAR